MPDQLPPELVPPSSRDLDNSVDFLKDLLRHDTNARNTAAAQFPDISGGQPSYAKARSLHSGSQAAARKDATVYRFDDSAEPKTYKSSSRHIDRRNVRASGDDSPTADLDEMKRELDNSQRMLDSSRTRDEEDEALQEEKDDLMYKIRGIQRDIERLSTGRRTEARDAERRRLDRELDILKFEKFPELEHRIEDREREKASKKRAEARRRDERGDRYSRFNDRRDRDDDRDYRQSSYDRERSLEREEEPDRGYHRGTYDSPRDRRGDADRERPRSGSVYDRPRSRSSYDRPPSPPRSKSAAPPRPPSPPPTIAKSPLPPPPAPASPAPTSNKPMTPEERQAYIKAEAQRKIQERLKALGVSSGPSSQPAVDASVSQRLEDEKKAAAARSAQADAEVAERERQRQARLEREKIKDEEADVAKSREAIQKVQDEVTAAEVAHPGSSVTAAAREELSKEEQAMKEREEALKRRREEREAELRRLEEENRHAEEEFARKKEMWGKKASQPKGPAPPPPAPRAKGPPPPAPAPRRAPAPPAPARSPAPLAVPPAPVPAPSTPSPQPTAAPAGFAPPPPPPPPPAPPVAAPSPTPPAPSTASAAPQAPPPPPPPPAPQTPRAEPAVSPAPVTTPSGVASTNPFHRLGGAASSATTPSQPLGENNPFVRQPSAAPVSTPSPAPPRARSPPPPADDWDIPSEKDVDEDSSDDEGATIGRQARAGLASALFGNIMPARPASAGLPTSPPPPAADFPPAPAPPAPAPPAVQKPDVPADRGALLGQIQSGTRLRKATTNDRSAPPVAGRIRDEEPSQTVHHVPPSPPATSVATPERQTTPAGVNGATAHADEVPQAQPDIDSKRQSMDWYGTLAAEGLRAESEPPEKLPTFAEEEEDDGKFVSAGTSPGLSHGGLNDAEPNVDYTICTLDVLSGW
jgi:hypothetical protein